jgi:hypothetical protein
MLRNARRRLELPCELWPRFVELELDFRDCAPGDAHPRRYRGEGEARPFAPGAKRMRVAHSPFANRMSRETQHFACQMSRERRQLTRHFGTGADLCALSF